MLVGLVNIKPCSLLSTPIPSSLCLLLNPWQPAPVCSAIRDLSIIGKEIGEPLGIGWRYLLVKEPGEPWGMLCVYPAQKNYIPSIYNIVKVLCQSA